MKFVVILTLATLALINAQPSCPGCVSELSGDQLKEAENTLTSSLSKLAAGEGPSYKLLKINKATSQVVSGIKYEINADLGNGDKVKTCDIVIISQPWLPDGIEVTFKCPDEEEVTRKHSA